MAQAIVKDLIDEVQRLANRVSPTERSRAREALNRALAKYAQRIPWKSLRRTETFLTDGTRFMVFPDRVVKVIEIADVQEQARIRPDVHFIENHGATYLGDVAGRPCVWRESGIVPLIAQPATDTTFTVAAGASETITVELWGTVRDASESGSALELYEVRETVNLTGSAVVTSNSFVDLRAISKDRSTTNFVTVTDDNSGKVAARIMGQQANAAYRRIEFETVPGAGRTVRVEYFTAPDRIDSELQAIDPAINERYLVWVAVGDLHWILKETQNAQVAWAKADEILAQEANKERTFGENAESITPDFTYQNLEDIDEYDY
jgi:hypothetical protein